MPPAELLIEIMTALQRAICPFVHMHSSPLPEAQHFRGKTLTPESPVPVTFAQNIPVLQNQTDPVFNLMSTHLARPAVASHSNMAGIEISQQYPSTNLTQSLNITEADSGNGLAGSQEIIGDELDTKENQNESKFQEQADLQEQENLDDSQAYLQSNIQLSQSSASLDPHSTHAREPSSQFSPSQNQETFAQQPHAVIHSASALETPIRQASVSVAANTTRGSDSHSQTSTSDVNNDGVNYQLLLDNIIASASNSTAPAADNNLNSTQTPAPSSIANDPSPGSAQPPIATLPIPAGLPPRPPPQEKPAIHPNYTPGEDIRTYHNPPTQASIVPSSYNSQSNNTQHAPQGYVPNNGVAANGLPPPPLANFQQQALPQANLSQPSPQQQQSRQKDNHGRHGGRQKQASPGAGDEYPRIAEVERLYEEFLKEEAIYVSEGTWDRFPPGSRLFVGNLFTERATKRDVFYIFHKYGRLAQISMKSAYGFVQYHDATACARALQFEQGIEVRGRKINLEISKPQKNTRNAAATAAGNNLRAAHNRRSRSPDYGRGAILGGQRSSGDRFDRSAMPNNLGRVRDDYRPARSPSPRGYRERDEYRGGRGSPDRYYRGRSRSPSNRDRRYRSRSPRMDPDDEANLPIPRRHPRDVPDVQLIVIEEVDRTFVTYVQKSFHDCRLRCDILQWPRVSLEAVIRRQMIEGVRAVVKIIRQSQNTGTIMLQVYERSTGTDEVRFNDYGPMNAETAAAFVANTKNAQMAPTPTTPQYPTFGVTQYPQQPQVMLQQQPQAGTVPPNLSNIISSLDGNALQKLLGSISQNPQALANPPQPQISQQPGQDQSLAALLRNVTSRQSNLNQQQQPPQQQQRNYQFPQAPSQQPQQQYSYGSPATPTYPPFANNQGAFPPVANAGGRPPFQGQPTQTQQQQPAPHQDLQAIMAQLAQHRQ